MKNKTKNSLKVFKLSPASDKLFTEYMVKCAADMFGDDKVFNQQLAKTLKLTDKEFNNIYNKYKQNPRLKKKFWDQYNNDLSNELTNPTNNPWKE